MYLSIIHPYVFDSFITVKEFVSEESDPPANWKQDKWHNPVLSLYEEFNLQNKYQVEASQANELVPDSRSLRPEKTALETVQAIKSAKNDLKFDHLIYCHETVFPSFFLNPSLYLKKMANLKQTLPFSVTLCGSSAFPVALKMLKSLYTDNPLNPSLIVTSDKVSYPQKRTFFESNPKGDASVSVVISPTLGDWKVCGVSFDRIAVSKQPNSWNNTDYLQNEDQLVSGIMNKVHDLLKESGLSLGDLNLLVIQNLSKRFYEKMGDFVGNACGVYTRSHYAPNCNLLSSDSLMTFSEVCKKRSFKKDQYVLLITAGPISSYGLILLKKR